MPPLVRWDLWGLLGWNMGHGGLETPHGMPEMMPPCPSSPCLSSGTWRCQGVGWQLQPDHEVCGVGEDRQPLPLCPAGPSK